MRSILEESMLETRSMPLENRLRLPRIPLSKRNRDVVRALNPMLVTYLKSLERPEVYGTGPGPDQADTVAFWRSLWSEPVNHNEGPWMEFVAS
ncbi:unnamed protein product [Parnassius apollo]|uniref:(apollo) hypothetical protein n=1 Tax=Parnassius apollo TaxID=110799 RepID=A0A8S3WWS1_PARAO|nr:unnamed protein product [Parnassius apollo]